VDRDSSSADVQFLSAIVLAELLVLGSALRVVSRITLAALPGLPVDGPCIRLGVPRLAHRVRVLRWGGVPDSRLVRDLAVLVLALVVRADSFLPQTKLRARRGRVALHAAGAVTGATKRPKKVR
jgi:hypothetical protein